LILKIESKRGLDFVAKEFVKDERTRLMAARGDLYVEIDRPHQILEAMKLIIEKDRKALAGSRMLLSVARSPVPEACDFSELAWLYDIGYRSMLLCDEICLKQELLSRAVGAFDAFRSSYAQ
jgi:pyruvate kinase